MARKLKVYGWQGHRVECPPAENGSHQTREFGNKHECELALAEPGVVFWMPIHALLPRDMALVRRPDNGNE